MQIWVDADPCPNVIKEVLFRAAERTAMPVGNPGGESALAYAALQIYTHLAGCRRIRRGG